MPSKSAKQAKFMRAVAHSPEFAKKVGVPQKVGKEFEMMDKKKKPMPKEGATGGSSTVPMTPERKAFMKRMQDEEAASKKGVKPNPSKYAKGGEMKKYAKGGSVSSRADGVAKKGKTKTKMVKMAKGGKMKGCK
jgi:hypothetical protein